MTMYDDDEKKKKEIMERLARMQAKIENDLSFEEMMTAVIRTPQIGDRVQCVHSGLTGTIIGISLSEMPFQVEWEDDSTHNIDRHMGNDLVFADNQFSNE